MKDRFDLEDCINHVWTTVDDIRTVADMMYDSSLIYDADRTHTTLHGLAEVLDAKCEKLFDTLKQVYQLDQYSTDPNALELRERLKRIVARLDEEESDEG